MAEATLRVFRGDRESGKPVDYRVPLVPGMVVLDALHSIQAHQAPDLAVRWNCKAGKCGSCSAEVNGRPRLTCKTRMDSLPLDQPITVFPMKAFPLIKDLVTDVSWNYKVNQKIPPFQPRPGVEWKMDQRDVDRVQEFRKCIECFLCQNVCHVLRDHAKKEQFGGPRFFVRVAGLEMHPLDGLSRTQLAERRAWHRTLQHHQVLHRSLPRRHPHHRQCDHSAERTSCGRVLRSAAHAGSQDSRLIMRPQQNRRWRHEIQPEIDFKSGDRRGHRQS